MILRNPDELKGILPAGRRLLGVDAGSKTLGLAVSDPALKVASPLRTLARRKFTPDAQELGRVCREYGVGGLVIGLPLNMDGSEGPMAQSVIQFARNLTEQAHLWGGPMPILLWDERLSTWAVSQMMLEHDVSRRKRDQAVDRMAAAWILQGAMDAMQAGPASF
ncbi:MAG: Holliday junction resolvase RuvX [Pseudomonadota bacterium]|nr:Holliday junction resolvase RuvX [Pseudomonadota bacterium]